MGRKQNRSAATFTATSLGSEVHLSGSLLRISAGGVDQSVVDLQRPQEIEFEYLQHMDLLFGLALENWDQTRTRAFHAGAGGCALALAWEKKYPQLSQVAAEIDAVLAEQVGEIAGLKRKPRLKLRVGDARQILESSNARYNLIIRDAFSGPSTPRPLRTTEWTDLVASRLHYGGLYLANIGKDSGPTAKQDLAAALHTFKHCVLATDPKVWSGHRPGNLVLAAWNEEGLDEDEADRRLRRLPLPVRLYRRERIQLWLGGATPLDR